jgi:hypothetical protein
MRGWLLVRSAALATVGGAYAALAIVQPNGLHVVPPCPLRAFTGLDCPLCGATRATRALVLHGDVARAVDLNALYVAALPVLAVLALVWWRAGRPPRWLAHPRLPSALAAVAVAFAVVRNLPMAPFRYLGS